MKIYDEIKETSPPDVNVEDGEENQITEDP